MDLKRIKAELYRKQRCADIWGNMAELNRINNLIYKINCRLRAEKEKEIITLSSKLEELQINSKKEENKLIKAKVETIKSQARTEELFEKAINAMRSYSGQGSEIVNEDEEW